jgi:hypothetical protein
MTTIRRADDVAATLRKAANIALWTLQVLVAMAFVAAGSGKLGNCRHDRALPGSWHRPVVPIRHRSARSAGRGPAPRPWQGRARRGVAGVRDGWCRRGSSHRAPHGGNRTARAVRLDGADCVRTALATDASHWPANVSDLRMQTAAPSLERRFPTYIVQVTFVHRCDANWRGSD